MMWERDTSGECPDVDKDSAPITDGSTSYIITSLEEDSRYGNDITVAATKVAATNVTGSIGNNTVTAMTGEVGKGLVTVYEGAHLVVSISPAPSAPPTSVRTYNITPFKISVRWGPVIAVNCIDRNGAITGYSMRYRVLDSKLLELKVLPVPLFPA